MPERAGRRRLVLATVVVLGLATVGGCSSASISQAGNVDASGASVSAAPTTAAPTGSPKPSRSASASQVPGSPGASDRRALGRLRNLTESMAGQLDTTTFRVATFNVLGASHTVSGGRHSKYAAGAVRMSWAVSLLRSARVEVAGLQEFQPSQIQVFRRRAPGWDLFPTSSAARISRANSIAWDTSHWRLVEGHTFAVPYFQGHLVRMPYVLLENTQTQQRIWFVNTHNPADAHGPAQAWRSAAVEREAALVRVLARTDTPVVLTGDMNDRAEFFCAVTADTDLHAASGGDHTGGCHPPADMGVDWILGTSDVTFDRLVVRRGGLVARTSDHPFLYADVSVGP